MFKYLVNPSLADSILDRLVPNLYRIEIKGESMRSKEEYGVLPKDRKASQSFGLNARRGATPTRCSGRGYQIVALSAAYKF